MPGSSTQWRPGAPPLPVARAAARLRSGDAAVLDDDGVAVTARAFSDPTRATTSEQYPLDVDRVRARFSTWYELFPRSAKPADETRHGTFADVIRLLPEIDAMGFDVLYLPPIHPVGTTHRKGRNNQLVARPDDVGSPWAIGSADGGHKSVHPELGTMADFRALVDAAAARGIDVALDIAFQCAPDHPYVRAHPEWFRTRPDGTIQYAENPPKRYEDIVPFDFESEAWSSLWDELRSIFEFWIDQGVRIFRVDNPHTKAFPFWEWVLGDLRRRHPTASSSPRRSRVRVLERLAKVGFNQSYTYFAWRDESWELREYFEELTAGPVAEYLRPNVWPNTPDILTEYLQRGGKPAFTVRAILAATLAASYGVYGPAFEQCVDVAREPGSEEYLDSEKYEIVHWDRRRDSLVPLLTRLNQIRREHPALQSNTGLRFHDTDNANLCCYSKRDGVSGDTILTVVTTDPYRRQEGNVILDLAALGLPGDAAIRGTRPAGRGCRTPGRDRATTWRSTRPPSRPTCSSWSPSLTVRRGNRRRAREDAPARLVPRRGRVPGPRPIVPGQLRQRQRRLRRPHLAASTTSRTSGSRRCGSCPSTRRRCATTATTSPTTGA